MTTKKVTVAEVEQITDRLTLSSITLAILSTVPDITTFERENGKFTADQREFLAAVFNNIGSVAIGLYAHGMKDLLLKFESNGIEIVSDTGASEQQITGDPAKFEELLHQFGGIKGSA